MTREASHYELQVEHPLLINDVPVAHFAAMRDKWQELPWWRRLFSTKPFQPASGRIDSVTAETQHIAGQYDSLDSALAAAEFMARERTGELHPWDCVLVVSVSGGAREIVDGVYPNEGGHVGLR